MIDARRLLRVLARVLTVGAGIAAALIATGILFVVLEGNQDNSLVSASTDAAEFLAGPFDDLFTPSSEKLGVAVSWGIGAIAYLVAGSVASRLIERP